VPAAEPAGPAALRFSDVTEAAGLNWGIHKFAAQGWNLIETMAAASSTSTATAGSTSTSCPTR